MVYYYSKKIALMVEDLPLIQDPATVLAGRDRAGKGREVVGRLSDLLAGRGIRGPSKNGDLPK